MTQPPRSVLPTAASAVLLLALAAPVTAATVQTFNNPNAVTIVEQGNALPYPSEISVSGVPSNFMRLEVRLSLFSHTFPDDVDILLVGPQGQRAILMSDAGAGGPGATGATLTFAQTAPTPIPNDTNPTTGTFSPANYANAPGDLADTFPSPGPGTLTDAPADLSVFNGINPNGTWRLFVVDDAAGDQGAINQGWRLTFTTPTIFTVNSTADTSVGTCTAANCTLRQALALAQDGDLINFSPLFNTPQTINLLTALPDIARNITIQGPGANLLTVRRDFNVATEFRIFNIPDGVTNGVAISGMTITGGNAGAGNEGGGILSRSHLTLSRVHVTGNTADSGGGVFLALSDGVFTQCSFSNNASTLANGVGGGISFQGDGGRTLRVMSSTVSGNRSANLAGGIGNVSLDGNSRLEITNSTLTDNTAGSTGGVQTFTQGAGTTATTTLRNTIVADNTPNNLATGTFNGGAATFQTLGFNLSDNYDGVFIPLGTDITSATPRLAPLALYGGQTPTHALLHASPAFNTGDASGATTDQRGAARVFGATADIGAVEMRPIVVANNSEGLGGIRLALASVSAPFSDIQFDSTFFSTPQTIELFSSQLGLTSNVNIIGPGANLLTISGRNAFRVFSIGSGITTTLSGMTIAGGNAAGDGGGVFNDGTLTVTHSTISNNSSFNPNISDGDGGGISNGDGARLTVDNSTITGNTAQRAGGGIEFDQGWITVNNSTISGNVANGGGFAGGGIDNASGSLTVTHSTISGNRAPNGDSNGGGIWTSGATTITNSTITNNSAAGASSASGLFRPSLSFFMTIRNSIIAGNVGNATQPDVVSSNFTSNGFNLIGNRGTVDFGATGDQSGTGAAPLNPLLGPLQNNGGTTATHALLFGSPALDRGNSSGLTSDQRGLARPVDLANITNTSDASDIGAFEAQGAGAPPTVSYSPSPGTSIVFPGGGAGTAIQSISVSSSGGVSPGAVSVTNCTASTGFFITNVPTSLTGTAGAAQISGNINLSCTRGASLQTGTLSCSETPNPGTAVTRSWTLSCPAAVADLIFGNGFE